MNWKYKPIVDNDDDAVGEGVVRGLGSWSDVSFLDVVGDLPSWLSFTYLAAGSSIGDFVGDVVLNLKVENGVLGEDEILAVGMGLWQFDCVTGVLVTKHGMGREDWVEEIDVVMVVVGVVDDAVDVRKTKSWFHIPGVTWRIYNFLLYFILDELKVLPQ